VMVPNYAAGKDMASGLERTFKGEIVGKDMTKWGKDAQLDFSAELAKAKASGAEALFVFYPGAAAGAFTKQYHQAGLRDTLPLYSTFTIDGISLPKLQKANFSGIIGSQTTQEWDPTLDNAANKKFVADYKAAYGGYPSFYAAQAYDSIRMIAAAVEQAGGVGDQDKVRAALKSANYDSVRGKYSYGNNHFPIQNFYLREVITDADGNWTTKVVDTVLKNHQDPMAVECKL
jgi:branched-chain amino acid transport system substrate-binding protein